MQEKSLNIYDIIENDKEEILILLYAGKEAPENPSFFLNKDKKYMRLTRNTKDIILIEDIEEKYIKKISKQSCIYVCELKYDEILKEGDESEIVYAYSAFPKTKTKAGAEKEEEKKQKTEENIALKEKISKIKNKYQQEKNNTAPADVAE